MSFKPEIIKTILESLQNNLGMKQKTLKGIFWVMLILCTVLGGGYVFSLIYKNFNGANNDKKETLPINAKNVNTGINNGVVGDVSTSPHLDEKNKAQLLHLIERLKRDSLVYSDTIKVLAIQLSNAGLFTNEIIDFLRNAGYSVDECKGQSIIASPFKGCEVTIDHTTKRKHIEILVGLF